MRWLATCTFLSFVLAFAACGDDEEATSGGAPPQGGNGGNEEGGGGSVGGAGGNIGGMGGQPCQNVLPNERMAPAKLSETGLYADIASKAIAADVLAFAPQYPLWSDGAVKTRWVYLPECDIIDNTDEDNWEFPIGMRMWKQFEFNGVLVETRMIHRYGPGANDFVYAAYQWDDMDADADHVPAGVVDTKMDGWDIPSEDNCTNCHGGNPNQKGGTSARYLGFGAIQLSHNMSGVTMATLSNDGLLVAPNPAGYTVPGTAVEEAALGYLHSNCGNCHNDTSAGVLFPFMDMRVKAGDSDVTMTDTYLTVVNQTVDFFQGFGCTHRIAGQDVGNSCAHFRMTERGTDTVPNTNQMPPLGTDLVDPTGIGFIEAWIATLPPPT